MYSYCGASCYLSLGVGGELMLTTISSHPGIAAGIISILLVLLGYFIRKVDRKIDAHSEMINAIKTDLTLQLATMRSDIKEDTTEAFSTICIERQGSCSKLQDAKLQVITATNTAICAKLSRLDDERREDWNIQRRWNDKVETTIYKDRGGR
jgi:hypothetical protein